MNLIVLSHFVLFLVILNNIPMSVSVLFTNLALKKNAYLSREHPSYPASYATDGITDDDSNIAGTQSNGEPGWLVVDLGLRFNVINVSVQMGINCCWSQMARFEVWLSNSFDPIMNVTITKSTKCGVYSGLVFPNSLAFLNCSKSNNHRYVILHQADGNFGLGVREFQIFGYEDFVDYFIGCYVGFNESIPTVQVYTPFQCFNVCQQRGYKYLAFKKKVCHCSNVITSAISISFLCEQSCVPEERLMSCPSAERFQVFRVNQCIPSDTKENSYDDCKTHCLGGLPLNSYDRCESCELGWDVCESSNGHCADDMCIAYSDTRYYVAECECRSGYDRMSYNEDCKEVDECLISTHKCSLDSTYCINTIGSYQCRCKEGFQATNSRFYCHGDRTYQICTIVFASLLGLTLLIFIISVLIFKCKQSNSMERYDNKGQPMRNNNHEMHAFPGASNSNRDHENDGYQHLTNKHYCDLESTACMNTIGAYHCQCKNGFKPSASAFCCYDKDARKNDRANNNDRNQIMNHGSSNTDGNLGMYTIPNSRNHPNDVHLYEKASNHLHNNSDESFSN
ncbi:hypothetical protein HELRODRAFT_163463 [Helobdella robusta]|uniref:EGF-like domain-containing protein n=1 Tax=Helobdella robusta TaxID=6412 RepID=T1EU31_HELRO|nr:hypothetical protein HELRODRAFT_163463 [Helobdella robusta]ESN96402.1 hypothetical protein HELRODRAFT_163463 [Helobdella robusta]